MPPLEEWYEHVEYVAELVGKDHVGFGSDFDGVRALPREVEGAQHLDRITLGFLKRGWSREELRKFYGENLLRAWERVRSVAASAKSEGAK